jgi:hypothetical protein
MSNALLTLSHIADDARDFRDAARLDGAGTGDAMRLIDDMAEKAGKRIAAVPRGAPIAVFAILTQDGVCDDVLDMVENCFAHVVRDRESAIAVSAKLQAAVDDAPADPDPCETESMERALYLIAMIDGFHRARN